MPYQPITPLGGIAGWAFLTRTMDRQSEAFASSADLKREADYFRDNIAGIDSAKDLVADRQMLKIALGAFGLEDDLNKQFFIRRVLEEGTENQSAMANRLVDKRYVQLADAFGFGPEADKRTGFSGFADDIIKSYETRQFEVAVGNGDQSLRLAMSFQREINEIANADASGDTGWFRILGAPPLRSVVEAAFNLPREFATLDIDRQVDILKSKSRVAFSNDNIEVFKEAENVDEIVQKFLVRSQISGTYNRNTGQSAALSILQGTTRTTTIEALFAALY